MSIDKNTSVHQFLYINFVSIFRIKVIELNRINQDNTILISKILSLLAISELTESNLSFWDFLREKKQLIF